MCPAADVLKNTIKADRQRLRDDQEAFEASVRLDQVLEIRTRRLVLLSFVSFPMLLMPAMMLEML
jgi:hypothetical protein